VQGHGRYYRERRACSKDYQISEKNSSGNKVSRNGSTKKNIKTAYGNIDIQVPRTREPGFEPEVIKKRAVIDEGLEPQALSMYAKGMSVRDITEYLQALYGIELSATPISNITDKVSQEAKDWYCGRWTAFTRLYSLMPCILKYVKKGGS
jgi:Transposase and inactivated derivatives